MPNHPVDVHVGSRLRMRRTLLGLSQQKLGEKLGLTFQQIQKYERGANRIGASRLFELSRILDIKPSFFFEEMPAGGSALAQGVEEPADEFEHEFLGKRETLELVRAYYKIDNLEVRKRVFDVIKALATEESEKTSSKSA
ncbi:helix-turn-helix domain-containing protein [Sneathiella chungangensis]|uniref:Helix-turn-helix domain-containing protein n=1 Tax=Sneathiella chungangensis TaxID=1418234 RepID=A0A845MJQ4_9PROT|nr:helix-turn-helix transcriptional regulator [Sneathiella chungangensis]MZR23852.1 helix-turn-helix domain-containing protein [Sneathiella chungangensis]